VIAFILGCIGTLVLVLPFNLFQSWIAAKIWLMLVVPLTGWPALTWAIFFGIAATLRCIHSRSFTVRRDEDKPDLEREHPWVAAFLGAMVTGFIGPILLYAGAWIVARIVL
jgi:hypothetical protein